MEHKASIQTANSVSDFGKFSDSGDFVLFQMCARPAGCVVLRPRRSGPCGADREAQDA